MKKFAAFLLFATGAVVVSAGYTEALGQSKKAPATKNGTIELVESKDGKYRFSVRNGEGKYLAGSPVGHETEKEAREAAEELKKVIATANFVSKKSDASKDADKSEKPKGK